LEEPPIPPEPASPEAKAVVPRQKHMARTRNIESSFLIVIILSFFKYFDRFLTVLRII
jgi:hypothetical protein